MLRTGLVLLILAICACTKATQILFANISADNKSYDDLICVSDDYMDAIAWHMPPNIEYLPKDGLQSLIPIEFQMQNTKWVSEFSYKETMGPVLDYTWETFPIIVTPPFHSGQYQFKKLNNITFNIYRQFEINLSIMASSEAHVFLCDDDVLKDATCLWIILGGWNGTKSALRQCDKGRVALKTGEYGGCIDLVEGVQINPISLDEWNHISIRYDGSTTLEVIHKNRTILRYNEWKDTFSNSYKYLFVRSFKNYAFWKYHVYQFYAGRFTSDTNNTLISKKLKTINNNICVSFLASHRKDIYVVFSYGNGITIDRQLIQSSDGDNWQFWNFTYLNLDKSRGYKFSIEVDKTDNVLIKEVNQHPECWSFRTSVLSITKSNRNLISCSSLSGQPHLKLEQSSNILCENNPETCQGCQKVYKSEECPHRMICENNFCYCRPGSIGDYCDRDCPGTFYGFGCIKPCGLCKNGAICSKQTGVCPNGCENNFIEPLCIHRDYPVLLNISATSKNCYDSCEIEIYSKELAYDGMRSPQSYFANLYKGNNLIRSSALHQLTENILVFENIPKDSDFTYEIVLCTDNNGKTCFWDNLVQFNFSTSCREMEENQLKIECINQTAIIRFSKNLATDSHGCDITDYIFQIRETNTDRLFHTIYGDNLKPISGLKWYTNYTVLVYRKKFIFQRFFLSDETVPGMVVNAKQVLALINSVTLTWSEPFPKLGVITHYEVNYKFLNAKACPGKSVREDISYTKNITKEDITLDELRPYSTYEVIIFAFTKKGHGQPMHLNITTKPSDVLIFTNWKSNIFMGEKYVELIFIIDCNQWTGPTFATASATCTSDWCINNTRNVTIQLQNSQTSVAVSNLLPFTNYHFEVFLSRTATGIVSESERFTSEDIQTNSSVPNRIPFMEVYSKTDTSISLRWISPYPPTGVLKNFHITYSYYYGSNKKTSLEKCTIWKEMFCTTVSNLYARYSYTIEIVGENENVNNYGNSLKLKNVIPSVTEPKPPLNIKGNWTKSNYLTLQWQRPNQTNGPLKQFEVSINNKQYSHSPKDDILIYKFEPGYQCTPQNHEAIVRITTRNSKFKSNYAEATFSCSIFTPTLESKPEINNMNKNTLTLSTPKVKDAEILGDFYVLLLTDVIIGQGDCPLEVINYLDQDKLACWIVKHNAIKSIDDPTTFTFTQNPNFDFERDQYALKILLVNKYRTEVSHTLYEVSSKIDDRSGKNNNSIGNWWWILIIAILMVGFAATSIFIYCKKPELISKLLFSPAESNHTNVGFDRDTDRPPDLIPLTEPSTRLPSIAATSKIQSKPYSKVILVNKLDEYLKKAIEDGILEKQHELFPRGVQKPTEVGTLSANYDKNRYKNLLAYDHSRVVLKKIPGIVQEDYINANYINSSICEKAYIATQGPKPNTIYDFWHMILTENVENIIILANLIENGKCKVERYWPDSNKLKKQVIFNDIEVRAIDTKTFSNFEIRTFAVTRNNVKRIITQLHFMSWPDHGIPMYAQSLLPFAKRILEIPHSSEHPILVHCSAGVGRTGTIILIDICLRMGISEQQFDALYHLHQLRQQRANMVDNVDQYKLVHLVLLEYFSDPGTTYDCKDFESTYDALNDAEIKKQMLYVTETAWRETVLNANMNVTVKIERNKNRDQSIVPEKHGCIYLRPLVEGGSTYINAVHVDGFNVPKKFIATQHPLSNTIDDFWRMVLDNDINVIVSLQPTYDVEFWTNGDIFVTPKSIKIEHATEREESTCFVYQLEVTIRETTKEIHLIEVKNWELKELIPGDMSTLLGVLKEMEKLRPNVISNSSNLTTPYLIVCRNGATACGLFIAMCNLLERIKLEQVCDVCQCVRNVRRSRKQFVTDMVQFKSLYRAASLFMDEFIVYSNFKPKPRPPPIANKPKI